ncbi:hypothetical protein FVQ98_13985 [Ottowia sp. GY511]|uniref:hypothetical protein n=1 Tax=Ottowia sp. GY511 TaxID=2603274 RepID=UPI0011D6566B|nr:hypothetical protein [Ottowia sp. GY511]TXK26483.1 hypothetical protein FVQ98_13985 [Ottowia sp. GY511]
MELVLTEFLKPSFVIAFVMLLGAAVLCWHGKVSEAGYLTVTLAVGAGFGLSTQAGQIVKELRK